MPYIGDSVAMVLAVAQLADVTCMGTESDAADDCSTTYIGHIEWMGWAIILVQLKKMVQLNKKFTESLR